MGPDGAVYIVDWYSPIIDHGEVDFHHPSRNKANGRIWRLTAKDRDLVKSPQIYGASTAHLLDLLKAPEAYTRMQANRELVYQGCELEQVRRWVAGLNPKAPQYEHHKLEALWLSVALNQPQGRWVQDLLKSKDPKIRGAAIRMLTYCEGALPKAEILAKTIKDSHPQVRLEAVNALRAVGTAEAASIALTALDQETDVNLDFALWATTKELQGTWMAELQKNKTLFGKNPDKLLFALKSANTPQAASHAAEWVQSGKLSESQQQQALTLMAHQGGPAELTYVLNQAVVNDQSDLLQALVKAPTQNKSVPTNTALLTDVLSHPKTSVRILAAQLIQRWKVPGMSEVLAQRITHEKTGPAEQRAATKSLAGLGEYSRLQALASEKFAPQIRSLALAEWATVQPQQALPHVLKYLNADIPLEQAGSVLKSYLNLEEGPGLLVDALKDQQLPAAVGTEGIRLARSSGRDLSKLVAAMTKAASLKPVGFALDEKQRENLLAEMSEHGNARRGREIYMRPQLLCTTCHLINNEGGKLGPDLSTVGSYMTPASLLESLVSPSTDIKQGYETVLVTRTDGTTVSGTLERKTENNTLIRQANGEVATIANEDIAKLDTSPVSLMPMGLTASLRSDELADLMKYLTSLGKAGK